MQSRPTFNEEYSLWERGYTTVAGIDEVGRGAFAGPVVAAAVILPRNFPYQTEINDSKLLAAEKREQLSSIIRLYAVSYAIAEVSLIEVNRLGIGKAAQKAFSQAVGKLKIHPDFLLIDAFKLDKPHRLQQKAIIHGDALSVSIAAASIIAKVYRDRVMGKLHLSFPEYNFAENKGYGTDHHRKMIKKYGLCPLHRTSFALQKFL
jgi:ribonuclease HII